MSQSISTDDALSMFEEGTGLRWKVIQPSEVKNYSSRYNTYVWTLCLDNSCQRMLYVVPENVQPTFSDYEKIIAYLEKHALPILPKIKLDLDQFPGAITYAALPSGALIRFEIKPDADIILRYKGSTNPVAFSPSKIMSIKHSVPTILNEYLTKWDKISIKGMDEGGKIELEISNSITNEFYDFDVTLVGNTLTATVMPTPLKASLGDTWEFEGHISLSIIGKIENSTMPPQPKPAMFNESLVSNNKVDTYILIGLGAIALTIATAGIGDFVIAAGAVGTTEIASAASQ